MLEVLLGLLMWTTFMALPLRGLRIDWSLLRWCVGINLLLAPVVAFAVTRLLNDAPMATVAFLVLIAPCVDYVVVFNRIAGGSANLLQVTPVLLAVQMLAFALLLPGLADPVIFIQPFVLLIVLPFIAAWFLQRYDPAATIADKAMNPLLIAVVLLILVTYAPELNTSYLGLSGVYALFALCMWGGTYTLTTIAKTKQPTAIATTFSGVTRNSLVVLPVLMALPIDNVPAIVVTQTLVELVFMFTMARIMRRPADLSV
ncbi:hypothetical protein [Corynebacterium camporealensis]